MKLPCLDVDFYSDEVIRDPYPIYSQLRDLGPVVYLPRNDLYALARYREVSEVLRQPLRFVSSRGVSPIPKVNEILVGSTLNSDPPIHDKTRSVTSEPLLPGALAEIEPQIKAAADGLIDTLCTRGEFDAIKDLAQFLPITIVAELVGLPQAVDSDQMLKWASATFNLFGTENARTEKAFDDLQNLRDFLQEYGRPEMLKPGGWAKRIFEVGPERGLSYDVCAQLMRDYINPSLDTTISATGQIIKFFADNPEQWDLIRADAMLIPNAIEEAVRMATPIRAFTRYVLENSVISGCAIPKDKRLLVIYASANRDERKFHHPDKFDVTRDVHDHVGFGQGVHMCMGMHLARREMILLLEALRRHVESFELLGDPSIAMNNTIRAYSKLPVRVHTAKNPLPDSTVASNVDNHWLDVTVSQRSIIASDIISLELCSVDGSPLPKHEAGSHVDVQIRSGLIRQYSLINDPADNTCYRIGILREPQSRGGSQAIHEKFHKDIRFKIGKPRCNFPLIESANHTLLIAGGIGITPLLSMAYRLASRNASWELHYCVRSLDKLAFTEELSTFGEHVHLYIDDGGQEQRLNVHRVFANPKFDSHLFICGPNGFMNFMVQSAQAAGWLDECIHVERFGAEVNADGMPFTLIAKRSGKSFEVSPGETIAEKLQENGIDVQMSCQSGVCGTCLASVLEGVPDHRDYVQTASEKASNDSITVCCSRSKTKVLVLDI